MPTTGSCSGRSTPTTGRSGERASVSTSGSVAKAKTDGVKMGCGYNKRQLPPCSACSTKKCHVCEGVKKEEADRWHEKGTGYTCQSCTAGSVEKEEEDVPMAQLLKKMESMESRQKSLEKELEKESQVRKTQQREMKSLNDVVAAQKAS